MHQIEPFYRWLNYYDPAKDISSPFNGKEYNYELYTETIYGYYIDPAWDFMGSETLYIKILYTNYEEEYSIIEFIGEWNDTINNDVMSLKRTVVDTLIAKGINKFILIGENVLNFHGSDDCYYEEWFEDVEDGWIVALNFQEHVLEEMKKYNIDYYINSGGALDASNWRTYKPSQLFSLIDEQIQKRLN
ncbi:MAG: hypothetical protein ACJA2S_003568 [Cyclobacteriaceae bacterium]|jgi:hypothetical protein